MNQAVLREFYGLTLTESRIVNLLFRGLGLQAVSIQLGIKLSTVRTHLHRIFDKTDTSNQAQLVSLLAQGLATVSSDSVSSPPYN